MLSSTCVQPRKSNVSIFAAGVVLVSTSHLCSRDLYFLCFQVRQTPKTATFCRACAETSCVYAAY